MPDNDSLSARFSKFVSKAASDERLSLYVARMRRAGWSDVLERGLEATKEIRDAIVAPTPYTLLRAGMSAARVLQPGHLYAHEVFNDQSRWCLAFPTSIGSQIAEVLWPEITDEISLGADNKGVKLFVVERDGVKLAWVSSDDDDDGAVNVFAAVELFDASVAFARKLLWESVDPSRVVITTASKPDRPSSKSDHGQIRAMTDDLVDAVDSDRASRLAKRYKKFLSKGVKRTVLFYGMPGTGKSTLVRTISQNMGLRSLRVRVEDVGALGSDAVEEMIRIFEPDVVVFDDLDRSYSQVALLEMMESLHRRVKLVLATVNRPDKLDVALRRPGRFDELVKVDALEESALKSLLGEYDDAVDEVRDWPVAFVKEYVVRRDVFGDDGLSESLEELKRRVGELAEGTADIEDEDADE